MSVISREFKKLREHLTVSVTGWAPAGMGMGDICPPLEML